MPQEELNEFAEILSENMNEEVEEEVEVEEEEPEEELEEDTEEVAEESEPEDDAEDLKVEEELFPEDLSQLAEAFEVDPDKIKGIKVATKKDGTPVSLDQVLANWDVSEAVGRKSQELSQM